MYDIIILNGRIIDGTGNPWYKADIGIKDGKIEEVGDLKNSDTDKRINAEKRIVSPGFIDMHSHSDLMLIANPKAEQKIMQGVTTELLGQDGIGVAPINEKYKDMWRTNISGLAGNPKIDWSWNNIEEYLNTIQTTKTSVNVATLVPHGNIRIIAMDGVKNRSPTEDEMEHMKKLLKSAYNQGAYGISTGLIYPPCSYSKTEELIELAKISNQNQRFFVLHIRDERDKLIEAVREVIKIGLESGCPMHISHFKVQGKKNWGKVKEALSLLKEMRKNGLDITCDQYPYTAGSTMLSRLIPTWAHEEGAEKLIDRLKKKEIRKKLKEEMKDIEWESKIISYCKNEKNKIYEGKNIKEIAETQNKHPVEALCDLLIEEKLEVSMINFYGCEEDVKYVMKHPLQMVCTDGLLPGKPHPRVYGTYPRIPGRYVRERKTLTFQEAIRKMTSFPAQRLGLKDRGLIKEGYYADITIFNPTTVIDKATYQNPRVYPEGIDYTIVNGDIVNENGRHTGKFPGKVLRKI